MQINIGILGVKSVPVGEFRRLSPSAAIVAATSDAFHMSIMIVRGLGRAITGNMQQGEVGGPVRIAEISGTVLNQGIVPFILLTAVISINLGLINLLPVPALDGGHLTFFFWEAILIGLWAFIGKHNGILLLQLFYASAGILGMIRWY